MRKLLITVLLVAFAANLAFTQNDPNAKPVVAVLKLSYSARNNQLDQYINAVQNQVEAGVLGTKRFIVVERTQIEQLQGEIQTQEVLSEAQVANLGKTLGAKYVFLGSLDNVTTEAIYQDDGSGGKKLAGYRANVAFQLKLVDVESTQIIASEQIVSITGSRAGLLASAAGEAGSEGQAISDAIGAISGKVEVYIAKNLPIILDLLQIMEQKKGKAVLVEILGGSEMGLKVKDRLTVVEVTSREIRGRQIETRTPIAELRVETVTGPETSVCRVVSGDDILFQKFEAKANIMCIFEGVNKSLWGR